MQTHNALVSIAMLIAATSASPALADPKIEEQPIAPAKNVCAAALSAHGAHVAALVAKGSRYIMSVDGTEGPKFDGMSDRATYSPGGQNTGFSVAFTDDGAHNAYAVKMGEEYVVIVDGKEAMHEKYPSGAVFQQPLFSKGGNHLFFANSTTSGNQLYVDCKPQMQCMDMPRPVISPDGSQYAYDAIEPGTSKPFLVVNGKQAAFFADNLQFTSTGHLVCVGHAKDIEALLLDAKPVIKAASVQPLWVSPTGTLVAAFVVAPPSTRVLSINGKPVSATEGVQRVREMHFSPDGKRYAALCVSASNAEFMVIDGKKDQEYGRIEEFGFSPDSSKTFYVAHTSKAFVVIDGEESDGVNSVQDLAAAGNHIGYITDGSSQITRSIVVDGKAKEFKNGAMLTLCNTGEHYAFLSGDVVNETLCIDGVEQSGVNVGDFTNLYQRGTDTVKHASTNAKFVLSPDGKHAACVGVSTNDPQQHGLFVDRKLVTTKTPAVMWAMFTPDSQHIFWAQRPDELYLDGKLVMHVDGASLVDANPANWEMQSDGTLAFVAQIGDKLERVRITPAADTNIPTMLAGK